MATPGTWTPKRLFDPVQLGVGSSTLYTVPAATVTKLNVIILVNDTTTSVTATLYLVPSGGAAGDINLLCRAKIIPSDGDPVVLKLKGYYMSAGDKLEGLASVADQLTVHASGDELS